MLTAVAAVVALASLLAFVTLAMNVVMARRIRRLSDVRPPPCSPWPKLSIVVPACNEADTLEAAAETLLAQGYPDLELILVDDRSTDGTGAIVDRLAARDARVTAIHIGALPDGWLGKVHAMHVATARARGEYVLFTDADVHFSPAALERAVAYSVEQELDHLCIVPDPQSKSLLVNTCIATGLRAIAVSQRPWRAEDPAREESIGVGAFNLVRREAFLATEGFEWLRMEVADDLGLGRMMKLAGCRAGVLVGPGDVYLEWYKSLGAVFRGYEKNAFAQVARFQPMRGYLLSALMVALTLSPFFTFLPLGVPWLWTAGVAAFTANMLNALLLWRWIGFSPLATFLSAPVGDLLLCAIVVRACVLGRRRGGLVWRGTVYPTAALKAGVRVAF